MLHFSEVFPLPLRKPFDYIGYLGRAKRTICIEQNASGQFARLLRAETGFEFDAQIHRYDGRPFSAAQLIGEINGHLGRV
jgi:2-oxoglutarate ferredoxin oxidoreductase subunit alpha